MPKILIKSNKLYVSITVIIIIIYFFFVNVMSAKIIFHDEILSLINNFGPFVKSINNLQMVLSQRTLKKTISI